MIFQDPFFVESKLTIGKQITEVLFQHKRYLNLKQSR